MVKKGFFEDKSSNGYTSLTNEWGIDLWYLNQLLSKILNLKKLVHQIRLFMLHTCNFWPRKDKKYGICKCPEDTKNISLYCDCTRNDVGIVKYFLALWFDKEVDLEIKRRMLDFIEWQCRVGEESFQDLPHYYKLWMFLICKDIDCSSPLLKTV